MASVNKPIACTNFADATGTDTHVYRTVMSRKGLVTPSPRGMKGPWPRLEQIAQAVYQVEVQWECDFDKGLLAELELHPLYSIVH